MKPKNIIYNITDVKLMNFVHDNNNKYIKPTYITSIKSKPKRNKTYRKDETISSFENLQEKKSPSPHHLNEIR